MMASKMSRQLESNPLLDCRSKRSKMSPNDDSLEYKWYHYKCFMECKLYTGSVVEKLENFEALRYEDQQEFLRLENNSTQLKRPASPLFPTAVRIKEEVKNDDDIKEEKEREALIAKQSKQFYSNRCFLNKYTVLELQDFLNLNGCGKLVDKDALLDRAADFMTFGVVNKCNQCKVGDFEFRKNSYICNGNISEWAMCENQVEKPRRHVPVLPDKWKIEWAEWNYEPIVQDRAVRPLVMKFDWTKEAKTSRLSDSVIGQLAASTNVDPKSELEAKTRVYKDDSIVYSVVLTLTDIQRNKNSYFKMQLLEESDGKKYHVFTSWGRIGSEKAGSGNKTINNTEEAIDYFESIYKEKTQNSWIVNGTPLFKKKPGCYIPIEIHEIELEKPLEETSEASKLPVQVQDLIKMMFDVNSMKKTMKDFMLDLSKLNPGRLKRKQLEDANQCLSDLYKLVEKGGRNFEFIGLSNKFYSLIPHTFGDDVIPIIDTRETINEKSQMIDSLLEIEVTHSLMNAERYDAEHPLDFQYAQLMTQLTPLDRTSEEFNLIYKYLQNSHGSTHSTYRLEIQEVFRVNRFGESKRFEKWQDLQNRYLLWHGSRLTNFVGILSHGLKIAPPEAPPCGYMFGKGIYFADMVTKSANYCNVEHPEMLINSSGLLLLCNVALGSMMHLIDAQNIVTLPVNTNSVMGLGKNIPNLNMSHTRTDGVIIPLGNKLTRPDSHFYKLLYNEYIVYDESQVKIEYLLKVFFKAN
ncbi:unnamed protein product [Diamesa hyperborea]